jgi:hypothetical protein
MKKLLLIGAVAFGAALSGITAQAAPVAGLATIQTEAAQSGDLQQVRWRGGRGWRGYRGYRGRWGYGYRRGYYGGYRGDRY